MMVADVFYGLAEILLRGILCQVEVQPSIFHTLLKAI
jgi:hypothetical protein